MVKIRFVIALILIAVFIPGCTPDNPANVANFPAAYLIQGKTETGTKSPPLVDSMSDSLTTVDIEHSELHQGNMFTVANVTTVAGPAGSNMTFQFLTPSASFMLHIEFEVDSQAEAQFEIYEGATVSANGTFVTPINRNRISTNVPVTKVWVTPTITSLGTLIDIRHWGSGKGVGGAVSSLNEWLFKPDTVYIIRIVNLSGATNIISFQADWYKHPY